MNVSLLSADRPEWLALVRATTHDFYHLPSYAALCAQIEGASPAAVLVTEGSASLILPILRRTIASPIASGIWDATSPYGYPGPLVIGADAPQHFAKDALDAASAFLSAAGCVSLFVRFHPLLGPAPPTDLRNARRVQHGFTVQIDLTKSTDVLWSETMSGHRNEINRAVKAGHRAFFDDTFTHADRFVEIYQATMSRVGASQSYFFDRAYVDGLREALGGRLKLALVEIDGAIAAAGLFVVTDQIVQYHLSGTHDAFLRERPTKLMLHHVRAWAKELGVRWFHLGGGVGGAEDSLFKFKAGFSKERSPFYTLRIVTDPTTYRALLPGADESSLEGFFPLYRKAQ